MRDTPDEWLTLPVVADRLAIAVNKVHQLIGDGALLARRVDGVLRVPAVFIGAGVVIKGLQGTITLLRDAGYDDDAAIDWLLRQDDSLPGTPAQALAENRGTEVKRRAQASAF
ncbi:MAG: Rv2175c family DNA-binding protein [Pseudonocardiales bacterium]